MEKELTIDILSSVQKPARYTGGEFGSIIKPAEETEVTIALAFPDVYEVGMSYLGFKILYHLLNKEAGVQAERPHHAHRHPLGATPQKAPLPHPPGGRGGHGQRRRDPG